MIPPLVAIGGTTLGFERPLALAAIPVLAVALWYLVLRPTGPSETPRRTRLALFATRFVIAVCLVTAAAGPTTLATRETPGEPRVTLLVDESASTEVASPVADRVERGIEAAGVPVDRVTVGAGNTSRIGDGIVANTEPGGSLVVVSDGRVTTGRGIDSAAEIARSANATVHAVPLEAAATERFVRVSGPRKTSVGVENAFLVRVGGVELDDERTELRVTVDGDEVASTTVTGAGTFEFSYRFEETGPHRVTASVGGDDVHAANDVFHKSVRAVERPRVLYVSRRGYPLEDYLDELYDVTRADAIPADLSPYYAVVLQDLPADGIGNVDALQRFVIEGNGLLVVGGPRSFDHGGYETSSVSSMLPVRMGAGRDDQAAIVLAVDISGSTAGGMRVQKALALDVLDQLGDQHRVGIVAFNNDAYLIADLAPLESARGGLEDRIRRLSSGGGTRIAAGLQGGAQLLGEGAGTIILISDGRDERADSAVAVADRLGERNVRVISVGVGEQIDADTLGRIASVSGGTYYAADETDRLRIVFGDESRQFRSDRLTVVDATHFVTAGVTLTADLPESNQVSVKDGADHLVATGTGTPAVASWRYGLGRVVTVTAYGPGGGLDGLLAQPDSLLVSKATNWAIGDPERKRDGVADVPDTTVGSATEVTYRGAERPDVAGVSFTRVGENAFRATVVPDATGFASVLDAEYAVNYPDEYAGYGPDPSLRQATETTGGRVFAAGEGAAIATAARRHATRLREVRDEWDWAFLVAGLVVFLLEVAGRRILVYRRRRRP